MLTLYSSQAVPHQLPPGALLQSRLLGLAIVPKLNLARFDVLWSYSFVFDEFHLERSSTSSDVHPKQTI